MSNLSAAALRQELLSISAAEIEDNVLQSFQYEGFNATYLYGVLRAREADFATFNRDVSLLCLIGLMRGTRVDKISDSMSAAGSVLLAQLVSKYTVLSTVSATNRKGSITIGRVMSVFPHICLSFAANGHIRDFGLTRDYTLPSSCRFPQFAALIPTTAEYAWLWEAFLEWAYDMDNVINGPRSNPSNVERFANITSTNSLFSNENRLSILTANGLSFEEEEETPVPPPVAPHTHVVPNPGQTGIPRPQQTGPLLPPLLSQGTPLPHFGGQRGGQGPTSPSSARSFGFPALDHQQQGSGSRSQGGRQQGRRPRN